MTDIQTIKKDIPCCGRCKSAKFMVWELSKREYGDNKPPSGAVAHGTDIWYLVRCDYFKLTVYEPRMLSKCEGLQTK
jgi:hypothetical protein